MSDSIKIFLASVLVGYLGWMGTTLYTNGVTGAANNAQIVEISKDVDQIQEDIATINADIEGARVALANR